MTTSTAAVVVALVAVLLLATLAGTAVALERWARTRGLALARTELTRQLRAESLDLDVPARPLLPALLRGQAGGRITARGVPVGDDDGHLRDLDAVVDGARLDLRRRLLTIDGGRFTAVIGQEDLGRIVPLPGVVTRLELRATGLRVWTVLAIPVDAEVLVAGDALVVVPDPLQVADIAALPGLGALRRTLRRSGLRIPLPTLPLGAVVEDVVLGDGEVTVTGSLPTQELGRR